MLIRGADVSFFTVLGIGICERAFASTGCIVDRRTESDIMDV